MIKSTIYANACTHASVAEAHGAKLTPQPGSLLGELVRLSVPLYASEFIAKSDEDLAAYGSMLDNSGPAEELDPHTVFMNNTTDSLVKVVSAHIASTRGEVLPLVNEFAASYQTYLATTPHATALSSFEIIARYVPSIVRENSFMKDILRYAEKNPVPPEYHLVMPDKTEEEISTYLVTGSDYADKSIEEWKMNLPKGTLKKIYNDQTRSGGGRSQYHSDLMNDRNIYDALDAALFLYILTLKAESDVDAANGMSLGEYKSLVIEHRIYASALINKALRIIDGQLKSNNLVYTVVNHNYGVVVHGDIYQKWLTEGGKPEVLLGALVAGKLKYSLADVNNTSMEMQREWDVYCMLYEKGHAERDHNLRKAYLLNAFIQSLESVNDFERTYREGNQNAVTTIVRMAKEYLDTASVAEFKDPHDVALDLVAKCRFYYTPAYDILKNIRDAEIANPNVAVREAALLAVIDYVSKYIADQIAIVRT